MISTLPARIEETVAAWFAIMLPAVPNVMVLPVTVKPAVSLRPTERATETSTVVAYVNIVGGQDDLVFDGDSVVEQHVVVMTTRSGEEIRCPACLIVQISGRRISRIDEYIDPAPFARLAAD